MSFFSEFLKFITENKQNVPEQTPKSEGMTKIKAENAGFKVYKCQDPDGKDCYEILKYNGYATDVAFPEYIDDLPVRIIGTNIFERKNPKTQKWENHWIETVRIPKTVILIKDYAFQDCKTLRNVYFEGDIPEIQPYAFMRCTELKNPPAIQKRITEPWIKSEIFDRTSPPRFEMEVIYGKYIRITKIISYREEIIIPEKINGFTVREVRGNVPAYRDERRRNCGNHTLKKLHFPDSVVKIHECAFMKCWGLEYLKLPNNEKLELYKDSFWGCEKLRLENIIFPDGKDYGDFMGVFGSCESLRNDYDRKKRAEYNERKKVYKQYNEVYLESAIYRHENVVINNYSKIRFEYPLNFYLNSNIIFDYDGNSSFFPFIVQCGRGLDKFYFERKKLYKECFNKEGFKTELYDKNILNLLPSLKRQLDVCYYRLISDDKPEEKYQNQYLDFVRKHAKKAVFRTIESQDRTRFRWCYDNNLITVKNYNSIKEYAKKKGVSYMLNQIEKHEFKTGEMVYSRILKSFAWIGKISRDEDGNQRFKLTSNGKKCLLTSHTTDDIVSIHNIHEKYNNVHDIHEFYFFVFSINSELIIDTIREYINPEDIKIKNDIGYFIKNGTKIYVSKPKNAYFVLSVKYAETTESPDKIVDMINQAWHAYVKIISEKIK